jgi:hypothetical protein
MRSKHSKRDVSIKGTKWVAHSFATSRMIGTHSWFDFRRKFVLSTGKLALKYCPSLQMEMSKHGFWTVFQRFVIQAMTWLLTNAGYAFPSYESSFGFKPLTTLSLIIKKESVVLWAGKYPLLPLFSSAFYSGKYTIHIEVSVGNASTGLTTRIKSILKRNITKGKKKKGKANSVTGHRGPLGCETLRVPHYLDKRLTDGGKVVSLSAGRPLPPRKIPGTHFC